MSILLLGFKLLGILDSLKRSSKKMLFSDPKQGCCKFDVYL